MKRPKLIIVDNNPIFRQRLHFLIKMENVAEVVGKVSTGEEFLALLANVHPDLVLLDVDMPHLNGVDIVYKALKILPGLKIFAFTMFGEDDYIINLIKSGVQGFILKSSAIYEVDKDIHSLLTLENYYVNNQILNIINSTMVNELQMPTSNNRISGRTMKQYT